MIYVDSREGSKELAPLIHDAVLTTLDYGDMAFAGRGPEGEVMIGCERKTIGDLVNSISTGRLSGHQLPGLLATYYRAYIIVEGVVREHACTGELEVLHGSKWRALSRGGRKYSLQAVWAYLTTLETCAGVVVRWTTDMAATARMVEWLERWWGKEWGAHKSHLQMHKPPPPSAGFMPETPSLVMRIACELPCVGYTRARDVAKYFGSVARMWEASEDEWAQIHGVGGVTAKQAWEALHNG